MQILKIDIYICEQIICELYQQTMLPQSVGLCVKTHWINTLKVKKLAILPLCPLIDFSDKFEDGWPL